MDIRINPFVPQGEVRAIASKSQAHRVLVCAALADKPTHIMLSGFSRDIQSTVDCLAALGAGMRRTDDGLLITPIKETTEDRALLECGESGTTLRFMLPLAGALGKNARLIGHGRLPQRPIAELTDQLEAHGCTVDGFDISGKLTGGAYALRGDISSQFISALLLALPLTGRESIVRLTTMLESADYVDMTIDVMARFGILVEKIENGYHVPAGHYVSPDVFEIEGDWSAAAAVLALGAFGRVGCLGLNPASRQGDKAIVDALKTFGAGFDGVFVTRGECRPFEYDAANTPDIVPVLAALALAARGTSRIKNVSRLRLKESDRIQSTCQSLGALGGDVRFEDGALVINGAGALAGGRAESFNDHRIVMALAVASCICRKPVIIGSADAVDKSYPGFFDDIKALGGQADVV